MSKTSKSITLTLAALVALVILIPTGYVAWERVTAPEPVNNLILVRVRIPFIDQAPETQLVLWTQITDRIPPKLNLPGIEILQPPRREH